MRRLPRALAGLLLAAACAGPPRQGHPPAAAAPRRAILVSFDALNERRVLETLPAEAVPSFRRLFADDACAEYAVPAWPSKTAASHASLWTGAYGDVNGIAANWQPPLPRDRHAITEGVSGYGSAALRAEPLWITAALAGRRVVGHHPTQAPGVPGYAPVTSGDSGAMAPWREAAREALRGGRALVLNGYNRHYAPDLAITERTAPPRPAIGWRNLERLGAILPPREIAWAVGGDSVFALVYGRGTYTSVLIAPVRDAAAGVTAEAAPADRIPVRGRPLARHFSAALPLDVAGGRIHLRIRVFALAPDASRFLIFQPAVSIVEGNDPAEARAYVDAIGGWIGNGAQDLLIGGQFGPRLQDGGSGDAELRYLESLELVTRQFMLGSEWSWSRSPDLMVDYFPAADEVDHLWYGFTAPETPDIVPEVAAKIQAMRARAWELVDLRLEGLLRFVAAEPGAALFVSGDHGMRPTWRIFRPNVALAAAGLLALDDSGRAVAARTSAYSPDGLYVMVNTRDWRDGTVPAESVAAVTRRAERAIRSVRGADGEPVVTRTWIVPGPDTLGRGGPVGGELYYETGPGYVWSREALGPAAEPVRVGADHGFPSISPDMYTVFCAAGAAIAPGRREAARTIDVAPTVSAWLGIPAPRHARGRPVPGLSGD